MLPVGNDSIFDLSQIYIGCVALKYVELTTFAEKSQKCTFGHIRELTVGHGCHFEFSLDIFRLTNLSFKL